MANGMYLIGLEGLLDGTVDMDTNTIKIALINSTEAFTEGDTTMTALAPNRLGTDQVLTSVTVTDGVFDASDPTWSAVTTSNTVGAAVFYKFVTNDAGSTPIGFIELTNTATNGGDITVIMDSGANKIFALNGP